MDLQEQIKELERKLAIKQAYLSLNFTFPRGNKIPQEIKDLIVNKLKDIANKFANEEEANINVNSPEEEFTLEERKILKGLVARVIDKQNAPESVEVKSATPIKVKPTQEEVFAAAPKKGTLITMDNVDPAIRMKIEPQALVRVIGSNTHSYFVECRKGNRFWIPKEDLDI